MKLHMKKDFWWKSFCFLLSLCGLSGRTFTETTIRGEQFDWHTTPTQHSTISIFWIWSGWACNISPEILHFCSSIAQLYTAAVSESIGGHSNPAPTKCTEV
jgi:hypothetical protein